MTRAEESSKFDHQKATRLVFPRRSIADRFSATFYEDRVLVSMRNAPDLRALLKYYQVAYFNEKTSDASWLKSVAPHIAGMCAEGCTPYLSLPSEEKWVPPEHDFEVPL